MNMAQVKSHTRKTKKGQTRVKAHVRKPKIEWISERGDELGIVVWHNNQKYDGYLKKIYKVK